MTKRDDEQPDFIVNPDIALPSFRYGSPYIPPGADIRIDDKEFWRPWLEAYRRERAEAQVAAKSEKGD